MNDYEKKSMGERICENRGYYIPTDNKKRQMIKDKQIQKKLKNIKITRMQTLFITGCILIAIIFLVIVIIITSDGKNIKVSESSISKVDVSKKANEIVSMYNRDGEKELFINEMNRVQNLVATYLISNMTTDENSKASIINEIKKEISSDNWNKVLSNKSTYYRGSYYLDDNGNVSFKFETKEIEPNWIKDEDVAKYITLN